MTENEIFNTLLENTYTIGQLHRRLRLLREVLEQHLFTTNPDTSKKSSAPNTHATDEDVAVTANIAGSILHDQQKEKLYHAVKTREDTINDLPKIILYVPISFADSDLRQIGTWFRTNVAPDTLLDIQVDTSLIAGAAISRNGTFRDYSLSFFLKKSRNVIQETLTALTSSSVTSSSLSTPGHLGDPGDQTAKTVQTSL